MINETQILNLYPETLKYEVDVINEVVFSTSTDEPQYPYVVQYPYVIRYTDEVDNINELVFLKRIPYTFDLDINFTTTNIFSDSTSINPVFKYNINVKREGNDAVESSVSNFYFSVSYSGRTSFFSKELPPKLMCFQTPESNTVTQIKIYGESYTDSWWGDLYTDNSYTKKIGEGELTPVILIGTNPSNTTKIVPYYFAIDYTDVDELTVETIDYTTSTATIDISSYFKNYTNSDSYRYMWCTYSQYELGATEITITPASDLIPPPHVNISLNPAYIKIKVWTTYGETYHFINYAMPTWESLPTTSVVLNPFREFLYFACDRYDNVEKDPGYSIILGAESSNKYLRELYYLETDRGAYNYTGTGRNFIKQWNYISSSDYKNDIYNYSLVNLAQYNIVNPNDNISDKRKKIMAGGKFFYESSEDEVFGNIDSSYLKSNFIYGVNKWQCLQITKPTWEQTEEKTVFKYRIFNPNTRTVNASYIRYFDGYSFFYNERDMSQFYLSLVVWEDEAVVDWETWGRIKWDFINIPGRGWVDVECETLPNTNPEREYKGDWPGLAVCGFSPFTLRCYRRNGTSDGTGDTHSFFGTFIGGSILRPTRTAYLVTQAYVPYSGYDGYAFLCREEWDDGVFPTSNYNSDNAIFPQNLNLEANKLTIVSATYHSYSHSLELHFSYQSAYDLIDKNLLCGGYLCAYISWAVVKGSSINTLNSVCCSGISRVVQDAVSINDNYVLNVEEAHKMSQGSTYTLVATVGYLGKGTDDSLSTLIKSKTITMN